ncbi:hypothetical protein AB6D08_19180 [Vibrio splendidus]
MRLAILFVGFCSLISAYLFGIITTSTLSLETDNMGDLATWAGATSTFFTFVFLIVQNKKMSDRQNEADRLRDLTPYNESIEKYNQLTYLLHQNCIDKSNEFTTIYKLLCKVDGSPKTEAILQQWHRGFKTQRHVTDNQNFQQTLHEAIWNIEIKELQSLYHLLSLTRKEVTSVMKIDLKLATFSKGIVLSERFTQNAISSQPEKGVISECIGNFCRELHSDNYRIKINTEIDNLNAIKQEFSQLLSMYCNEQGQAQKEQLKIQLRQLSCVQMVKIVHQYFQYFEMLAKEVALLEDAQIYLEKNYGYEEHRNAQKVKGAHTVLLLNLERLRLLDQLTKREVVLFELYPSRA